MVFCFAFGPPPAFCLVSRSGAPRWIDVDVFLMADPTPVILAHAESGDPAAGTRLQLIGAMKEKT